MKTLYRTLAILFAALAVGMLAACGDDSADDDVTASANCSVTAAVLGGLPCVVHTTASDGRDSTYEAMLTGANYPLSIDQRNNRIYLNDSLPAGTDISRVTFASFTYNGAGAAIRSLQTAGDTIFNTADSTDCRLPRLITIYASDGTRRQYTLELKVHKQTGDEMSWEQMSASSEIAALQEQKLLAIDGCLYLFGRNAGGRVLLTSTDEGAVWHSAAIASEIVPRSVNRLQNRFVALTTAGRVAVSTDGVEWTPGEEGQFDVLVASSESVFGVAGGAIWSSMDAVAWRQDPLSLSASLPVSECCGVALPSRTNASYEDLLLAGYDADGNPALWHRTIDNGGSYVFAWNKLQTSARNDYPLLQSSCLLAYDEAPVLIGLSRETLCPVLYMSRDRGRTWLASEIELPEMAPAQSVAAAMDSESHLFVTCGTTGETWRGRLARLAWRTIPTQFYRAPRR